VKRINFRCDGKNVTGIARFFQEKNCPADKQNSSSRLW
jgi:hypothetical protein